MDVVMKRGVNSNKYIILRDIFLFFAAFYALIFEDISFGTSCMLILAVATDLGYNLYTTKFNIPK